MELAIDNGLGSSGVDQTSQATVTINIPPKPVISIAGSTTIDEAWGSTVLTVRAKPTIRASRSPCRMSWMATR